VLTDAFPPGGLPPNTAAPHRPGAPRFLAPRRPVRVRGGAVRLRFGCDDPDGCTSRTFVMRGRAFKLALKVPAGRFGAHVVRKRLSRRAQRAVRRAGRGGVNVRMRAADGGPALRFRLIRAR
jgi:hypothetical protein